MGTSTALCIFLGVLCTVMSLQTNLFKGVDYFSDKVCTDTGVLFNLTKSVLKCAGLCDQDVNCYSFFHNKQTQECIGLNLVLSDTSCGSTWTNGRYYMQDIEVGSPCLDDTECHIEHTTCNNGLCECIPGKVAHTNNTACIQGITNYGAKCIDNTGCYGDNIECWLGECLCIPGYHKLPKTKTCHTSCTTYGSTFSAFLNSTMGVAGSDTFENKTIPECMDACIYNTTDCKTMRYAHSNLLCRTDARTPLDLDPGAFFEVNGVTFYMRDCE